MGPMKVFKDGDIVQYKSMYSLSRNGLTFDPDLLYVVRVLKSGIVEITDGVKAAIAYWNGVIDITGCFELVEVPALKLTVDEISKHYGCKVEVVGNGN